MARFDVYRLAGGGLVLDCQADLLSQLATRFVIPLMPVDEAPPPNDRLNPIMVVDGERLVMVTQFAAAVRVGALGPAVASMAAEDIRITNAIDMLIGTA